MFIVFEGIDGCGKSTQVWKLAKYISGIFKYAHIVITREPYKKREIREILRLDNNPYSQKEKITELYIKDRWDHINEIILPSLQKGAIVISDRYKYSTICYQAAQGMPMKNLIEEQKNMPIPDFVFFIDTSVDNAVLRMQNDENPRDAVHKFEQNKDFLEQVRQNYLKMQYLPKEKFIIIDGNRGIEEIFEDIKKYFEFL